MTIFSIVEKFLKSYCSSSEPLLLALSGGPDSLCLFYCLLMFKEKYGLLFHIAHVDHAWRQESQEEAQALKKLAQDHCVPFHLKRLDPHLLKGNLEAACREERYSFFSSLCREFSFQGLITGHHQDDQAETICKHIFEGAHWSNWKGLKAETWRKDMRIFRPLLNVRKSEIYNFLSERNIQPYEDPTNQQSNFLRARFRQTIFPWLNREFGKQVQTSFVHVGKDAEELASYFEDRLTPLLEQTIKGQWGVYLDLEHTLPQSLLEIKYLIRLLCAQQDFFLSREIIEKMAVDLREGKSNRLFVMGLRQIWVDRKRLFLILPSSTATLFPPKEISVGTFSWGDWEIAVSEEVYSRKFLSTSWKEGWKGYLCSYLPRGRYFLGDMNHINKKEVDSVKMKKQRIQAKVPAFLSTYFPCIYHQTQVCHEFLTGKPLLLLNEGMSCWKIEMMNCIKS